MVNFFGKKKKNKPPPCPPAPRQNGVNEAVDYIENDTDDEQNNGFPDGTDEHRGLLGKPMNWAKSILYKEKPEKRLKRTQSVKEWKPRSDMFPQPHPEFAATGSLQRSKKIAPPIPPRPHMYQLAGIKKPLDTVSEEGCQHYVKRENGRLPRGIDDAFAAKLSSTLSRTFTPLGDQQVCKQSPPGNPTNKLKRTQSVTEWKPRSDMPPQPHPEFAATGSLQRSKKIAPPVPPRLNMYQLAGIKKPLDTVTEEDCQHSTKRENGRLPCGIDDTFAAKLSTTLKRSSAFRNDYRGRRKFSLDPSTKPQQENIRLASGIDDPTVSNLSTSPPKPSTSLKDQQIRIQSTLMSSTKHQPENGRNPFGIDDASVLELPTTFTRSFAFRKNKQGRRHSSLVPSTKPQQENGHLFNGMDYASIAELSISLPRASTTSENQQICKQSTLMSSTNHQPGNGWLAFDMDDPTISTARVSNSPNDQQYRGQSVLVPSSKHQLENGQLASGIDDAFVSELSSSLSRTFTPFGDQQVYKQSPSMNPTKKLKRTQSVKERKPISDMPPQPHPEFAATGSFQRSTKIAPPIPPRRNIYQLAAGIMKPMDPVTEEDCQHSTKRKNGRLPCGIDDAFAAKLSTSSHKESTSPEDQQICKRSPLMVPIKPQQENGPFASGTDNPSVLELPTSSSTSSTSFGTSQSPAPQLPMVHEPDIELPTVDSGMPRLATKPAPNPKPRHLLADFKDSELQTSAPIPEAVEHSTLVSKPSDIPALALSPPPPPPMPVPKAKGIVRWPDFHTEKDNGTIHHLHKVVFSEADANEMADNFREMGRVLKRRKEVGKAPSTTKGVNAITIALANLNRNREVFSREATAEEQFAVIVEWLLNFKSSAELMTISKELMKKFEEKKKLVENFIEHDASDEEIILNSIENSESTKILVELYFVGESLSADLIGIQKGCAAIEKILEKLSSEVVGKFLACCLERGNIANLSYPKVKRAKSFPFSFLVQLLNSRGTVKPVFIHEYIAKDMHEYKREIEVMAKSLAVVNCSTSELMKSLEQEQRKLGKMREKVTELSEALSKEKKLASAFCYENLHMGLMAQEARIKNWIQVLEEKEKQMIVHLCAENMELPAICEMLKDAFKIVLNAMNKK